MKRWTIAFIFNSDFSQVLLIHKQHPEHQKGKWNGIGGKYEDAETAHQCIRREVQEETNLDIPEADWKLVGTVGGTDWSMEIFTTYYDKDMNDAQTMTDEKVAWFPITSLPKTKRNLLWLIPLCRDSIEHNEIKEIAIHYTPVDVWK